MSYEVTLDALGTSYAIPSAGQTNYVNDLSLYLRDLATVINDTSSGSLVTPVYNVKTYGATGNGSTNDTTAILAAMAALAINGTTGGTLYFPAGTYVTSQTLSFGVSPAQRNIKVTGDGASSVIKPTGAFSASAVLLFSSCDYWEVSYITIDASARTGAGDNLSIVGSSFGLCTQTTIKNAARYGVSLTGASTYNIVNGNTFSGNTSGNTHVVTSTTAFGNITNPIGGSTPLPFTVDIQQRFGVAADGTTDDTAAIQAALDFGYNEIVAGRACGLQFPPGDMKITSTLVWKGNSANAPALFGAIPYGGSFDVAHSRFMWYGADNGTMFYAQSANCGLLRDLQFWGRNIAACCCHLAASLYASPTTLAATNGIRVQNCTFEHVKIQTDGNAAVWLGTNSMYTSGQTWQQADVRFDNCFFVAEDPGAPGFTFAGMKAAGVLQLQGGNCKLFSYNYCNWDDCNVALDVAASSGPIDVLIAEMGDVRTAFKHGSGTLNVIGGDIECANVDDFRLLDGGTTIGGVTYLRGIECAAYMAGAVGTLTTYGGTLTLEGCSLLRNNNYSVSGDPAIGNPFKLVVADGASGGVASFRSVQNFYHGCGLVTGYIPLVDGSGNPLAPNGIDDYAANNALKISSWGDLGGAEGTYRPLGNFDSSDNYVFGLTHNGPLALSYLSSGDSDTDSGTLVKTVLSINASSLAKVVTLPTAAASNRGRYIIATKRDTSTNTVTVQGVVLRKMGETAEFISGVDTVGASVWEVLSQPAGASNPGTLTVGAQTIGGTKTFSSPVNYAGGTGITAHAGGGQGSAVALTAEVNFVTTVASSGDSVKLPTAALGLRITVFNQGANATDIFPVSGGQIDALGTNAAYSLSAGSSKSFYGKSSTAWFSG